MNKTGNYFLFAVKSEKSQDGFVLVLTLIMLAVLSLLGVMVLNTTDTELAITSNFRSSNDAFVVSELGVEYSKGLVIDEYYNLDDDINFNIDSDPADGNGVTLNDLVDGLNLSGVELETTYGNEIDHYLAAGTSRRSTTQSADNTTNVYTTTEKGGAQDVPYYRISVDVSKGRSSSRVEAVVERIANTSL